MALMIGGYDRIIRHRGNGIEAVEILWPPGTRTPKHNHGSKGWVWVLQGRIFEVRNGKKSYYEAGDAFLEVDREESHIVGNDTDELAITFHVYQPELQMEMFSDSGADIVAMSLRRSRSKGRDRSLITAPWQVTDDDVLRNDEANAPSAN